MLIDVGVNLLNKQFRSDRLEVISRAQDQDVQSLLITSTTLAMVEEAFAYCVPERIFCTAGIHPHDTMNASPGWETYLRLLAQDNRVRAIGETGLDFNRNFSPPETQIEVFAKQVAIAQHVGKPLFVHDRESDGALLNVLRDAGELPPTVIHCFTGTAQELGDYLDAGFYIGITGWVTDPQRGETLRQLVGQIPLSRLLLESDAPYLKPFNLPPEVWTDLNLPNKYKRRNEPAFLPWVLHQVAALREESAAEIAAITSANAAHLFGFRGPS